MKLNIGGWLLCIILSAATPGLGAQEASTGAAGGVSPAWRHALGGTVIGVPAVQAESLVALCDGGSVEAYSSRGTRLWSFNARGRLSPYITRSPEGASYICRTNGRFIVLNRTGRELWRLNLGSPLSSPALVGWDGRIFIPTARRIDCYTASGYLLWSKPLTHPLAVPPQPDKRGGILTVQDDGELLILSPYGKAITHTLGEVPAAVVPLDIAAARLLAPDTSKAAEALVKAAAAEAAKHAKEAANAVAGAKDAAERAAAILEAEATARAAEEAAAKLPPVFDGNEQTVLVLYKNGRAESIRWYNNGESNHQTGGLRFAAFAVNFPSLGSVPLAAQNRNDTIGAIMANGKVLLFSVAAGRIIWSADSHITAADTAANNTGDSAVSGDAVASLIYDERGLYVLTRTGAAAYTSEGTPRWTIRLQGTASRPAFDDEGMLYSGGSDWVLNAYHMENILKLRKQSRYGPAAEGSYTSGDPRPSPWGASPILYDPGEINARLGRISAAIRKGQVGEQEQHYTAYLMEIAGSMEAVPLHRTGGLSPIIHPPVPVNYRAEAARLLSFIGSREIIPFLANLCRNDPDTVVKAAAAEAIGAIGVDPDGAALAAFTALVFPQIPGRDERVMASIAAATGALCRFSGPPLSQEGTRVLTAIASLGPSFAQGVARRELDALYKN